MARPSGDWSTVFGRPVVLPRPGKPHCADGDYCYRSKRERVWHCGAHGYFLEAVPCGMLDCVTCAPEVKARRGRNLYKRFGGTPLAAFVFTFPTKFRYALGMAQLRELRRQLAEIVTRWYQDREGVRVGMVIPFHPTGDSCPRCRKGSGKVGDRNTFDTTGRCEKCHLEAPYVPHFEVLVPATGLDSQGHQVELLWSLPPEALADLKARWLVLLEVIAGRVDPMGDDPVPNVHYSFKIEPEKRMHRWAYGARPFPAWRSAWAEAERVEGPMRWTGLVQDGRGLPVGLASPGVYGLAAGGCRARGIHAWRDAVSATIDEGDKLCPTCSEPMELVEVVGRDSGEWWDYVAMGALMEEIRSREAA